MHISFRVKAKTSLGAIRTVSVARDGSEIICDCGGFDGVICSHIDAVLVAGERSMVFADDLEAASTAASIAKGLIVVPENWRGSWRRNMEWRGLTKGERQKRVYARESGKPLVCFTGNCGQPRSAMIAEARANGWEVLNGPSPNMDVLVAADPTANSAKLDVARKSGIPIVDPTIWSTLMTDGALPS